MSDLDVPPITATVLRTSNYPAIKATVGDFTLTVQATPKGRKVFLTIEDGSADVQIARKRNGQWE